MLNYLYVKRGSPQNLTFDKFIDSKTLQVDLDKMITEVKNNSPGHSINKKEIKGKIDSLLKSKTYDSWDVCSGHDLIQILSIGLKKNFGNFRAKNISAESLDGIIRLTYEFSYFTSTQLYKSIKKWEKKNPSYRVFT